MKKLKSNNNIVITRPDKGSGFVIIDKDVYNKSINDLFSDRKKFQGQLQRRLLHLKKKGFLSQIVYDKIYPNGSKPARAYGLPKLQGVPKKSTHSASVNINNLYLVNE